MAHRVIVSLIWAAFLLPGLRAQETVRPNIIWITSEDNGAFLGCYGDSFATTPHLDRLASRGFMYSHAFSNTAVCAPSRNTIITGVYANSNGHQNMRSTYPKSEQVELYPRLLRKAGYYCSNRTKEDFNIDHAQTKDVWNALGPEAHYKNRPRGTPFFSVFNIEISHESSLFDPIPDDKLRHRPEKVKLPPYHPDSPEMRHDWAQYYDKVEDMDAAVGKLLKELEESGEAENTIVFYYSDHGGVLARSKRYLYDTGTRVPFIVYIPEKFKKMYPAAAPGQKVNRLVSFVDLAPTLLSIADAPIPPYMQGRPFLGAKIAPAPAFVYQFRDRMDERFDMSRAVVDGKFRYIRNYMPHRIYGQYIAYLFRAASIRSWEEAYKNGTCNELQSTFWKTKPPEELYDRENDPWEVHNLAADPAYMPVLNRMRKACHEWMLSIHDTGFIPEAEMSDKVGNANAYDYMRQKSIPLDRIIQAADFSSDPESGELSELVKLLDADQAAIRYWAVTGMLIRGEKAQKAIPALKKAAKDPSNSVSIVAAEALYRLGEKETGRQALLRALASDNMIARTHALNVIEYVEENSQQVREAVLAIFKNDKKLQIQTRYDHRCVIQLFDKWGLNLKDYGIQ